MKNPNSALSRPELDALEARFALRLTARLGEHADAVPHDVSERLRFARERAMERAAASRKAAVAAPEQAVVRSGSGTLALGGPGDQGTGWWWRLASALPIVVLVGGLVLIQHRQREEQISVAAEVDAALLADDVPPAAYADPGFVEFLKAPRE
jgi:hypothetical protein